MTEERKPQTLSAGNVCMIIAGGSRAGWVITLKKRVLGKLTGWPCWTFEESATFLRDGKEWEAEAVFEHKLFPLADENTPGVDEIQLVRMARDGRDSSSRLAAKVLADRRSSRIRIDNRSEARGKP